MQAQNTITQMRRGFLEFCIVSLLANNEVYTAELIDRLKKANLLVTDGTLYPLLNRLQKAGLLQYRWEESESGPPRKYYSLTEPGRKLLNELDSAWQDINESVKLIRSGTKKLTKVQTNE
ncbi:MAG: PadR family transcriptional regulator [Proteobacteria bacterium]|nr:PadR family transcriptional regulator [Pseudomonadota bacterium]